MRRTERERTTEKEREFAARLRRVAAGGVVLLPSVGGDPAELLRALPPGAGAIRDEGPEALASAASRTAAAIALPPGPPGRWGARLEEVVARLPERGWLLAALPARGPAADPGARDELRLALHEAGLVPLDELPATATRSGLILARRDPFRVRALAAGEEGLLAPLFRRCFHAERPAGEWTWRYRRHPRGGPWSSVAIDAAGEAVAHYGAYPVLLERREGERFATLLAAQVGDLMSAPEVRTAGRGATSLFARTGDHFYAARRRDGVAFSYGVHAGASRAFSVRFAGAVPFLPAPLRVLPAGGLDAAVCRRARVLRLGGWRARRAEKPDPRFDGLHERARHGFALLARRDRQYLAWRYFDRPGQQYELHLLERGEELLGWGVFRREAERLVWGDAICEPSAADGLALLLASALGTGPELPERVEGWFSPRPLWWQRALEGLGFRPAPDPQDLVFTCVGGREPEPATALRDTLYLTRGDSDLF
jgi:hypothetical protein